MLSLHHPFSPHKNPALSSSSSSSLHQFAFNKLNSLSSSSSSSSSCCWVVGAVKKDSEQFEINPDEAKQALQKLDQQLQAMSKRQISIPKIKASDVKVTMRGQRGGEEMPQVTASSLAYTAFFLIMFTVLYNIMFYAVIKPSIDGPDYMETEQSSPTTTTTKSAPILQ